jgi:azurin
MKMLHQFLGPKRDNLFAGSKPEAGERESPEATKHEVEGPMARLGYTMARIGMRVFPGSRHDTNMNIKRFCLPAFLSLTFLGGVQAYAADSMSVNISCYDTMKYSVTEIDAHPGESITVNLKNAGSLPKAAMAHNFVLLNAGTDPNAYSRLAVNAKDSDYQPKSLAGRVIASTKMLGPQESASVTFKAPSAPGSYPYLCSFPAHCGAGMHGVLIVK